MIGRGPRRRGTSSTGFTLIEVVGALVIFALGVLMVIQTSGALSRQMEYSARTSAIVTLAHEWLDLANAVPFDSLAPGTTADTTTVSGLRYRRSAELTLLTPILMRVEVTVAPLDSAPAMPSYAGTTYAAASW